MPKFRIYLGNPSDPGIEYITAHSFETDAFGNLKFKNQTGEYLSLYAAGSWYKVEGIELINAALLDKVLIWRPPNGKNDKPTE